MSIADAYERYLLPYLLDAACSTRAVRRLRQSLVPLASGDVLEIGLGTGLNLRHYDRARIRRITGLEPAASLHGRARRRGRRAGVEVGILAGAAERIAAPTAIFDTVLTTFTLCTVRDPGAALAEMRRVLRPEGRLIFCEHGLSPDAGLARWQRRLTPAWRRLAGGCRLDRDVLSLLSAARFACAAPRVLSLPGPRPWTWVSCGVATPQPGLR